jgi:hypothetical protein
MTGERHNVPSLPMVAMGCGFQSLLGRVIPPSGKVVAYVRSTGWVDSDPPDYRNMLYPTLNQALAFCRSGYSDIVIVLAGHTENISTADAMSNLVAGARILGMGKGSTQATLRFTATGATFLLDVADVILDGLYLKMEGASGVVAPITVSAADCQITNCRILVSSGASNKATTAITVGTGAERFVFTGNRMLGALAGVNTALISVTGVVDNLTIENNIIQAAVTTTGTNGPITITGAATNIAICDNRISNQVASGTCCIRIADGGVTGFLDNNKVFVGNNTTVTGQGIIFTGVVTTTAMCGVNYCTDEPGKSGVLTPVAGT